MNVLTIAESDLFDVLYGALVSGALERCKTERELGPLVHALWGELVTESPEHDLHGGAAGSFAAEGCQLCPVESPADIVVAAAAYEQATR